MLAWLKSVNTVGWLAGVSVLLSGLLLAGCGALLKPVTVAPVAQYALLGAATGPQASTRSQQTLLVTQPTAAPGYQSTQLIYVTTPYRLQAYANHRWVAPPAQLLGGLIQQSLMNTKRFKTVVLAPSAGMTDYTLLTHLMTLQQDFLVKPSEVRLVMTAVLMDNHNNHFLGTRQFSVTQVAGDNPYAGVQAANKATVRLLTQLNKFVIGAVTPKEKQPIGAIRTDALTNESTDIICPKPRV